MDAVKLIEERRRMCKSFDDRCTGCPAFKATEDELLCIVNTQSPLDATTQIAIVEEWSAAHPCKTRQSVFLEQWPEAARDKEGILDICPQCLDRNLECGRNTSCGECCREFWTQEAERWNG